MTVDQVYKSYEIKVNKNDTNKNIKISKGLFVKMYNEQSKIWLERQIELYNRDYRKNQISELLSIDAQINLLDTSDTYARFTLPDDYFDYASSFSVADRKECKDRILINWDFKIKDRSALFQSSNFVPSFDYEETLVNISQNTLVVFKNDFTVKKQFLTYFTTPVEIEMSGYIKEDGTLTEKNINPNLSDLYVNKIVDLTVLETVRIFGSTEAYQLAGTRITNN